VDKNSFSQIHIRRYHNKYRAITLNNLIALDGELVVAIMLPIRAGQLDARQKGMAENGSVRIDLRGSWCTSHTKIDRATIGGNGYSVSFSGNQSKS